jgi:hypothetical protein
MKKLMKRMRRRTLRDKLHLQKLQENKEKTDALLVQHKTLNAQLRADSTKEKKEAPDREVLTCCERDEFKGLVQVAEEQLDISNRLAQDQSEEAASASQRTQEIRDECVEKGGWSRVNHRTAEARVTWANTSTQLRGIRCSNTSVPSRLFVLGLAAIVGAVCLGAVVRESSGTFFRCSFPSFIY